MVTYNIIELNNVKLKNIYIYGDINESSLISLEMGENKKNIIFQDISINNVNSNGNIINIKGNDVNISLNNIYVNNSISYGSFLKCDTENVKIEKKKLQ